MYSVYQIMSDDTLENVSRMFETDVQTLERLNGINSIMPGQMLVVPQISSSTFFDTYIIEKGDNLYNIAKKYSTDLETLQYLNGLEADDYIYPGQKIMIPKKNVGMYIVNENETLNSVSKKLGVSVEDLIKSNEKIYLSPEQSLFFKKGKTS